MRSKRSTAAEEKGEKKEMTLQGKAALVTGAATGIGRAIAERFAREGARVAVNFRSSREAAEQLVAQIRAAGGTAIPVAADVSVESEVRAMLDQVEGEFGRLDVLVNNAGIGTVQPGDGRRMQSQDGYELRFAVNYLAGYLLTRSLLTLLQRSTPARVVNVSSAGQAPIDLDDVLLERHYDGVRAYCQSKLAQIMFTFDLAEELDGRVVSATCLHPGTYMPTKMVHAAGVEPVTPLERGVEATLRLVAGPELEGVTGVYFDGLRPAAVHPQANDPDVRRQLRERSDHLCGLTT
jgi:NAD(P)-dependent dehydrogenase (short-subunit alcohol dehydrogenase family)